MENAPVAGGGRREPKVSGIAASDKCATCGHEAYDHEINYPILGKCEYVKWIGGHPEYRCMCSRFAAAGEGSAPH